MAKAYPQCSLAFLTLLSTLLSSIILVLSLINYSYIVLCLNAAATGLALVYHTSLVLCVCCPRLGAPSPQSIHSLRASIACCAVSLALWIAAFAVSVEIAITGPRAARPAPNSGPWNLGIQIALSVLVGLEFTVMALYLWACIRKRFCGDGSPPKATLTPHPSTMMPPAGHGEYSDMNTEEGTDTQCTLSSHTSPIRVMHQTFVKIPPPPEVVEYLKSTDPNWDFVTPEAPLSVSSHSAEKSWV
ncbi:hypothetical protein BDZ97DRAFT_1837085 [Flammula alnicola]|nr:hypothetical protein BDZ97DRAFT_1837085 [Flammula alnicola]